MTLNPILVPAYVLLDHRWQWGGLTWVKDFDA